MSLYWFTGSGATSAHAVYEGLQAWKDFAADASGPPPKSEVPVTPEPMSFGRGGGRTW
ncbi:hypothetical protein [Actinomadura coerulea]|uniref:hypothetical protein n=1 Tax=Actinomadura coerulea TaxID=46159 RepID=UPI003413CFED